MDKNLLQTAKAPMIALINPQAPKGRHDLNHGCNPWAETQAQHGCNPCAVTHRAKTLLLLLLLAMTTAAQAQTAFGGGSGTEPDPYLIYTTDHLDQLAADVNNGNMYENTYFKLVNDLDYTGKTYTPIGGAIIDYGAGFWFMEFRGIFLGNYKSINNVNINSEDSYCGLFGYVGEGGQIYALTLGGNSSITSIGLAGGIAGLTGSNGVLSHCHVGENVMISVHPIAAGSAYGPDCFGGIAGISRGYIRGCSSRATVTNGGIAKTENLGGIVGKLVSGGGVENCVFLGAVNASLSLHVGDVVGYSNGNLYNNYYHTSPRNGGVDGNDTDGAKWMGTVTFGEHVSGYLYPYYITFMDGSTPYCGAGGDVYVKNMNYDTPAGYIVASVTYSANGVALVEVGSDYRFTMPDADVTITGSATIKRDIGYSDWMTINIPTQAYTGNPLTPSVAVTDHMTGSPVTLVEGTDYTVTLPDGGCTDWGNYTITITGIGDFGGQTTAVFTVTHTGSGTETDPYIILTTDDLDALAASVNGGDDKSGLFFRLEADLDYSGKTYTPIGTNDNRFRGTFEGLGHSIDNVVINQPGQDYQGLFGVIGDGGTVMNLILGAGSSITGKVCVGSIVGYIVNGTLSGCVNKASVSGTDLVGGIVGYSQHSAVSNNFNLGAVSGGMYSGGIIGAYRYYLFFSNNYYAGACNKPGIEGTDKAGQAMRGWVVSAADGIFVQQMPDEDFNFTGITYDGIIYLGAGQTGHFIVGRIDGSAGNFAASAGTLTPVSSEYFTENYYALAMPTEGQDVVIASTDIALTVPGYGTSENGGWRFIASPVEGSIEAENVGNIFFPNHDLYYFDQSEELEWRNYKANAFAIENGKGYLYAAETDITLFFSGPYNEAETQDVPLVYDGCASFAGWNLVGNPFPVAAYANRSYYTMNAEGTAIEPNAVSSETAIPVCTGVMVKADGEGESVTFSRASQQSAPSQGSIQIAVAQANTRGNAVEDKAIVSFNDGDQLGKFVFNEDNAKLYIPQGGKDYAIAVLGRDGVHTVSTEIPVNFKAAKNGTYTLNVNVENMDVDYLHLIDNMTGADIDLLSPSLRAQRSNLWDQGDYTFTATPADYASRFRLVFSANDEADGDAPFAYIDASGNIIITGDAGTASLQIVDMMGRVICCTDGVHTVSTSGIPAGVYVLRLINGENVRTQKIVVE